MKKAKSNPETSQENDLYLAIALARGLRTLRLLAEARTPLPLVEISRRLNLTRGVAFRLVHTLEVEGYIERVDQVPNYRPSAKIMSLGFSYLRTLGLPELARVDLEQLRSAASASVHLAILDKREVVYVSRLPAKEGGVDYLEIGDRSPAHASAIGLAMLSQLTPAEVKQLFEPSKIDGAGIEVDASSLLDELSDITKRGYARSVGALHPNVFAIAAPILNATGQLAGGISITTLESNAKDNEHVLSTHVIAAARQISEKLGFSQPQ